MKKHPNFPPGLDIQPLIASHEEGNIAFDSENQGKAIEKYGIAGRVWEAAHIMVQYLRQPTSDIDFDPSCSIFPVGSGTPCTILELGSGNGFVGINLARQLSRRGRIGDLIVLTDLPDVCPLLDENVALELGAREDGQKAPIVRVQPLAWGIPKYATGLMTFLQDCSRGQASNPFEDNLRFTHIICSDLVYFPDLLAPLLRSLLQLTALPNAHHEHPTEVLISYKVRSLAKESPFWSAFGLWFTFSPVSARRKLNGVCDRESEKNEESDLQYGNWYTYGIEGDTGFLFSAFRLPESYGWVIPQSDEELLSGVGARGTLSPKNDDTFETILLLSMCIDE